MCHNKALYWYYWSMNIFFFLKSHYTKKLQTWFFIFASSMVWQFVFMFRALSYIYKWVPIGRMYIFKSTSTDSANWFVISDDLTEANRIQFLNTLKKSYQAFQSIIWLLFVRSGKVFFSPEMIAFHSGNNVRLPFYIFLNYFFSSILLSLLSVDKMHE